MKRTILAAMLFLGAVGSLTACGTSASPAAPSSPAAEWEETATDWGGGTAAVKHVTFTVTNAAGQEVHCIFARFGNPGGPSCDWDHPVAK